MIEFPAANCRSGPSFAYMVNAIHSDARGVVVLINAYFDESNSHPETDRIFVSGYAFDADCDKIRTFESDWRTAICPLPVFHASDFNVRTDPTGITQRERYPCIYKNITEVIHRYAICGLSVSVDNKSFEANIPERLRNVGFGSYSLACLWIFKTLPDILEKQFNNINPISYYFEQGHRHRSAVDDSITLLERSGDELGDKCRFRARAFIPKETPHLGPADHFGYECLQDYRRPKPGSQRRDSLTGLLYGQVSHYVCHWDERALRSFVSTVIERPENVTSFMWPPYSRMA